MGVILNGLKQVLILALSILPDSPFRGFLDNMAQLPYLGYINWLIPISDFWIFCPSGAWPWESFMSPASCCVLPRQSSKGGTN